MESTAGDGEPADGPDRPITVLEVIGGGMPLTNPLNLDKDAQPYTYACNGNSQILVHMLTGQLSTTCSSPLTACTSALDFE